MLRNLAYRRISAKVERARTATPPDGQLPAFSVVITAHNQCDELRSNLPLILNQIYDRFEVVIVDINSTDGTKELLERLEEDHQNLHHTFTPATSRDVSAQRLAITLGIRASMNPWIVLTQANCTPLSHQWLRRLGESIAGHRSAQMAVGYTRYDHADTYTERRMRFFRFWKQMLNLNDAQRHGCYQCDGTNLVYNKELFFSHQGFASHSTLLTGATDIMVNQHSTPHNTAVCLHPEATIEQKMPHHKFWRQDRLFFQETRKYFKRTFYYRSRYAGSVLLHMLLELSMLATIGISIWQGDYIVTAIAPLLWLAHFILQGMMVSRSFLTLEDCKPNIFSIAWFLHLIPYWNAKAWLRHLFSDKRQYRKKYI